MILNFVNNKNLIFIISLIFILVIVGIYCLVYMLKKRNTKSKDLDELSDEYALEDEDIIPTDETKEVIVEESVQEVLDETSEVEAEAIQQETTELVEETVQEESQSVEEQPIQEETSETVEELVEKQSLDQVEETVPLKKTKNVKKSLPNPEEATLVTEPKKRVYKGKYEVYSTGDEYAYTLKASNGEILIQSELYTSKEGVLRAIDTIKRNVEEGEVKIFADKRGRYKFKVISNNYRVLAIGANYQTEKRAISAAESFKKFALNSDIIDIEIEDKDLFIATYIDVTIEPKEGGKYVIEKYDSEYSWMLKANNGEILCQADGYTSKNGCLFAIETFKKNVNQGEFKCVKDKNGAYLYKLYNQTGRVCAIGQSCPTKQGAIKQARSVKAFHHTNEIVEI